MTLLTIFNSIPSPWMQTPNADTSPPVENKTPVKTLPCPKLRLRAVKIRLRSV